MKIVVTIVLFLATMIFSATGVTIDLPKSSETISGFAKKIDSKAVKRSGTILKDIKRSGWKTIDSLRIDEIIKGNNFISVGYNSETKTLEKVSSHDNLTASSKSAVLRVPKWLREDLSLKLSLLTDAKQDMWANLLRLKIHISMR
jgi:hypothetical protein